MSLKTPVSLQKLQTALHEKAKGSPNFRFHALYDKVYQQDVLVFAYACCKANGGAAGVDGQKFEDIEEYGVKRWLDELAQELKTLVKRPIKPISVEHDKVGRLYVNQHKFEAGLVLFPEGAPFLPELEMELLSFPQAKHDDMVDSISQALSYKLSGYNHHAKW